MDANAQPPQPFYLLTESAIILTVRILVGVAPTDPPVDPSGWGDAPDWAAVVVGVIAVAIAALALRHSHTSARAARRSAEAAVRQAAAAERQVELAEAAFWAAQVTPQPSPRIETPAAVVALQGPTPPYVAWWATWERAPAGNIATKSFKALGIVFAGADLIPLVFEHWRLCLRNIGTDIAREVVIDADLPNHGKLSTRLRGTPTQVNPGETLRRHIVLTKGQTPPAEIRVHWQGRRDWEIVPIS
ncbi:hypothetical protein [Micromonospora sp. NPDC051141]|uniref:hypothetical protein n=1 Tax=Micromonospora sp. NPDC051141 TaxID=3364284 RepID=UPI00379DC870